MRRAPHPEDLGARLGLKRCVRDHGPFDVVHAHSSKAGLVTRSLRIAAAQVYTPHCIYTMNPEARASMRRATLLAERLLGKRSQAIIAVSADEERHMREIGLPSEVVRHIPNGVGPIEWTDRGAIRRELGLAEHDLVVGFLGRLSEQKNPLMLVRAFAACRAHEPRLRLCVTGDGPLGGPVRALARELGVGGDVVLTGHRSPSTTLPAFDVFALPSRYEGMPYVLLEALSAGLPLVTTRVGGVSETLEDGVNGLVAESCAAQEFAHALGRLAGDAALRTAYGARSRERASQFTLAVMVERTLALYRELVAAREPVVAS